MKKIAITMGDPAGIGPEIIAKFIIKNTGKEVKYIVIGNEGILKRASEIIGLEFEKIFKTVEIIDPYEEIGLVSFGKLDPNCGKAAYLYVERATKMALNKEIDAMVTAPLNKESLHLGGFNYAGHTEILATICKRKDYAMFLSGKGLNIFHNSTHVSLLEAINRAKKPRIQRVISLAIETLKKLGYPDPKIAVSGLNPHAGENGLFGKEEIDEIIPAIKWAREQGYKVEGPEPPDTVYLRASKGHFDGVIAMYHDQGHIPLKMMGFDEGVNITVGLPIIRTSVDHGTAFDIAGKGVASQESLEEAVKFAKKLI